MPLTSQSTGLQESLRVGSIFLALVVLSALTIALSLLTGPASLEDPFFREVLLGLRATRTAAAFLTGSCLSIAGVVVQGLFHNPLASPSIIGTTAGANLGARLAVLAGVTLPMASISPWFPSEHWTQQSLLPLGCVGGAVLALCILLALTRSGDNRISLLLTGFLLSSLFVSVGGLVTSLLQDRWELSRAILSFSLGDVSNVSNQQIGAAAPLAAVGAVMAWLWARPLDLLLTGPDEAQSLGLDVKLAQRWAVVWISLLTAAAVIVGGNIGFVGLIIPHALRPIIGVQHHRLIAASALAGGGFVTLCDILCRVLPGRTEMPLGVVTGVIGAPCFLWLLLRNRRTAYAA